MGGPTPFDGHVAPYVGLLLLQSLRDADTPADEGSLQQSDLPLNLRRRLGLSSVVEDQIRRYASLRSRDVVAGEELASLFRLINRRPDARAIFREAGRRLAARHLGEAGLGARVRSRALPERARQRLALRRMRGIAREVNPASRTRTETRPPALVVEGCLPAQALAATEGCAVVEGAMTAVMDRYVRAGLRVAHPLCEGAADDRCLWRLQDATAGNGAEGATDGASEDRVPPG